MYVGIYVCMYYVYMDVCVHVRVCRYILFINEIYIYFRHA